MYNCIYSAKVFATDRYLSFLLFPDEEGTIEEQEFMEGEADHKAELVDLAKDGTYFLWYSLVHNMQYIQFISKLGFGGIQFL